MDCECVGYVSLWHLSGLIVDVASGAAAVALDTFGVCLICELSFARAPLRIRCIYL